MNWPVDKPIPAVLRDCDLRQILGQGHSKFFARKKRGEFRHFELKPQLPGSATRYSGRKVQDWIDGIEDRSFAAALHVRRSA